MKKIILSLMMILFAFIAYSQEESDFDYVFLNNGTVIKGVIEKEEPNATISIRDTNGELYTYKSVEVRKVAHGKKPKMPNKPQKSGSSYSDYSQYQRGFWYSFALEGAYSTRLSDGAKNGGYTEIDAVGGYRFNQFIRVGAGIGARWYFQNSNIRNSDIKWAFPLFVNVRGNIIPEEYRSAIPYYSLDIGGTIRDGLMIRPTIGMRFGEPRSAFLLGVSYVGQSLINEKGERKLLSFVALKVGYEF